MKRVNSEIVAGWTSIEQLWSVGIDWEWVNVDDNHLMLVYGIGKEMLLNGIDNWLELDGLNGCWLDLVLITLNTTKDVHLF